MGINFGSKSRVFVAVNSTFFRNSEYCVRRVAHENVSQGLKTLDPFQSPNLIEKPVRIVIPITSTRSEDLTNCGDHVNVDARYKYLICVHDLSHFCVCGSCTNEM